MMKIKPLESETVDALRSEIAQLKKNIEQLKEENAALKALTAGAPPAPTAAPTADEQKEKVRVLEEALSRTVTQAVREKAPDLGVRVGELLGLATRRCGAQPLMHVAWNLELDNIQLFIQFEAFTRV